MEVINLNQTIVEPSTQRIVKNILQIIYKNDIQREELHIIQRIAHLITKKDYINLIFKKKYNK